MTAVIRSEKVFYCTSNHKAHMLRLTNTLIHQHTLQHTHCYCQHAVDYIKQHNSSYITDLHFIYIAYEWVNSSAYILKLAAMHMHAIGVKAQGYVCVCELLQQYFRYFIKNKKGIKQTKLLWNKRNQLKAKRKEISKRKVKAKKRRKSKNHINLND